MAPKYFKILQLFFLSYVIGISKQSCSVVTLYPHFELNKCKIPLLHLYLISLSAFGLRIY